MGLLERRIMIFQKYDLKVLGKICHLLLTKKQKAINLSHLEHLVLDPKFYEKQLL